MFNLVADKTMHGKIYPALARWEARPYTPGWRQFGDHWPYTTPLRVQEYCEQHGVSIEIYQIDQDLPENTFYPICLGFFDFNIDYIDLLPEAVFQKLSSGAIKLLFFYHEGDNPRSIKSRLDHLCRQHDLNDNCYVFVSSNSAATSQTSFVHFVDFELWYYQRNIDQACTTVHQNLRSRDFTILSRMHKWWRAAIMADLYRNQILDSSYWSYCQAPDALIADDCPIEIDLIPRLRWDLEKFTQKIPCFSDDLTDSERNDHGITLHKYHDDSYCNIVLESQFDVDQSGGSFLTEKTFKPIKHGQLFFIAGGAGSLQCLRDLGYRTFDHVLDNSYDTIINHTERWRCLLDSIIDAKCRGLHEIYIQCLDDIRYNQNLFQTNKKQRLNKLSQDINAKHH
jgi:hypothetical protein